MKHKRLIITLSIVLSLALLLTILSFTLFKVDSVQLHFKNQTVMFAEQTTQTQIINNIQTNYKKPAFAVSKTQIINELETKNPYLQVVNIEIGFPNKLIIHCAEREELFYIATEDEMYYICDSEFKILDKTGSPDFSQENAILLNNVKIANNSAQKGEFLNFEEGDQVLKNIGDAIMANNKTFADAKAMFKQLKLTYETNYYTCLVEPVLTFTTYDNFDIKVCNVNQFLNQKINIMLSLITHPDVVKNYKTHYLVVDINPQKDEQGINKPYTMLEPKK
ncbi:MAG: FtsQ-type POTRA domain-containing protein [Clostridiales bacterium]|nr:FtsQ-type POTRA domain-containing protein [Clostridiales bacterium]